MSEELNHEENIENEIVRYDGECKYFLHEPYMTPNNYDIFFDSNKIPSNIKIEHVLSLQKKLQKLMPLTKIIHVQLNTKEQEYINSIAIVSRLKINNKEVKLK